MVVICAYNYSLLVEKRSISISEYYECENPLIDEDAYRRRKGVNKIKGTIYSDDSNNIIVEQFVNCYDVKGRLVVSNTYNAEMILTDTSQIYYDFNQYIGYCELNVTMLNNKLNSVVAFVPLKRLKYVIIVKVMESHNDDFVLADKNITTQIFDSFTKVYSYFDTKPTIKYRVDVSIEVYDCDGVLEKSKIVSNVLADLFNNAY